MPLSLRSVEPVEVSLNRIPDSDHYDGQRRRQRIDELQTIANGTMANLMRQMSNLSDHIANLMTDLNNSAVAIDQRMENLANRTARLQEKYQKGGGFGSHVGGLADNHLRKAFQTAQVIDQHSLSRQTLPAAMAELYNRCDPPPRLNDLNEFRDDGKPALKFYTDPGYFFDLWKEQILRECENDRRMRSARAHAAAANLPVQQGTGRSPQKRRKPQQQPTSQVLLGHFQSSSPMQGYGDYRAGGLLMAGGGEFMQFPTEYQVPQVLRNMRPELIQAPVGMSRPQLHAQAAAVYDDEPLPPPPIAHTQQLQTGTQPATYRPPTIIPTPANDTNNLAHGMNQMHVQKPMESNDVQQLPHIDDDDELPPPPPSSVFTNQGSRMGAVQSSTGLHFLPPGAERAIETQNGSTAIPPAPTVSAVQNSTGNSLTESTLTVQSSFQRTVLNGEDQNGQPITISATSTTVTTDLNPLAGGDARPLTLSDQIKEGKKLKKVQRQVEAETSRNAFDKGNVMEIMLQRRLNMLGGAASSSSSEKGENDDDEWDD
ncbi:Wiskott-Aldrich syndrome protein family member [Aphelenchoides besseyi]|nr:Wiskott-Aldrich syndrome protein family member [Aphelenchoides besseyi]